MFPTWWESREQRKAVGRVQWRVFVVKIHAWTILWSLKSCGMVLRGMVTRWEPYFRKASGGSVKKARPVALAKDPSPLHWHKQEVIRAAHWMQRHQPRARRDKTPFLIRCVWWADERDHGWWSWQEQTRNMGERQVWREFSQVLIQLNVWCIPAALAFYWLLQSSKP